MNTLTIQTEGKKYEALIAFLTSHDIPFESSSTETKLDRRLREAREEYKNGELIEVNSQNLWEMIK